MRLAELKNHQRELRQFQVRVGLAGIAVLVAFAVLLGRFAYLQVIQHDTYIARAEDNRISVVPIPPSRGMILDRNGVVLARNYSAYTLEIARGKVPDLEATLIALGEIVDIQPKDRARYRKLLAETRSADSLPIRTRLGDDEVARFAANRYRFPGVDIRARLFRQYPQGTVASHVVGYIGRINERDQQRLEAQGVHANYRGTEFIGRFGVEASYQHELHGITGLEQVEIDAGGRGIRTLSRTPAQAGNNVTLTLDIRLQDVIEKAFAGRRGALVAIEPSTGSILALVSSPGFDPNHFVDGIDPQNWAALNESPDRPLNNRAIAGTYPPGSTFKPFMALAALESGKRTPKSAIHDPGHFVFGDRRFRDSKPSGHGYVDLRKSIVVSSDTYYYQLANDMGIEAIAEFMDRFGFGSRTGIDLEGEVRGVLPSPAWKRERFRRPEQQKWYAGETISIGIGQGYNTYTPLQLARATAALAANGALYRPRLVSHVDDVRTGQRRHFEPQLMQQIALRQEHIDFVKNAMAGVNLEGTGARVFAGAQYTSAGKTGTSQVIGIKQNEKYDEARVAEHHRDHSLFVAFAPLESPKIALAVLVENGGFGSRAAAPLARIALDYYLLGKLPEDRAASAPAGSGDDPESD